MGFGRVGVEPSVEFVREKIDWRVAAGSAGGQPQQTAAVIVFIMFSSPSGLPIVLDRSFLDRSGPGAKRGTKPTFAANETILPKSAKQSGNTLGVLLSPTDGGKVAGRLR